MKVHANVMIKDESLLLEQVLPHWNSYPVDEWVIYNDSSTDNTIDLINSGIDSKVTVLNDNLPVFDETHYRSRMLEHSRGQGADYVIAIDADELLSSNFVDNFKDVLQANGKYNIHYYWYNVVDSLQFIRQDPLYLENYKSFIMPVKHTMTFDKYRDIKIHTPRTAPINLPLARTKEYGFIHLQAINRKFYALKQLRYKHYEYHTFNQSIGTLNAKYDPVVNGLNFMEVSTPRHIIDGISFDPSVYEEMLLLKGYEKYIKNNMVEELVTFGKEYL